MSMLGARNVLDGISSGSSILDTLTDESYIVSDRCLQIRIENWMALSNKEAVVLELLLAGGEMYGLELVGASAQRLKKGTVYVTLGRMEDKGYVESWLEERASTAIGLPRRLYRPTAEGRRRFDLWAMVQQALMPEPAR